MSDNNTEVIQQLKFWLLFCSGSERLRTCPRLQRDVWEWRRRQLTSVVALASAPPAPRAPARAPRPAPPPPARSYSQLDIAPSIPQARLLLDKKKNDKNCSLYWKYCIVNLCHVLAPPASNVSVKFNFCCQVCCSTIFFLLTCFVFDCWSIASPILFHSF